MESKSSKSRVFTIKALLGIAFITTGLAGSAKCSAQSIVGKWKLVSAKMYLRATNVPTEHLIEGTMEFRPDHSYVVNDGPGKEYPSTGEWSVAGNQLTMRAAAQIRAGPASGSQIYLFSITGNKMVRTMMAKPPYDTRIYKTEDTSTRM